MLYLPLKNSQGGLAADLCSLILHAPFIRHENLLESKIFCIIAVCVHMLLCVKAYGRIAMWNQTPLKNPPSPPVTIARHSLLRNSCHAHAKSNSVLGERRVDGNIDIDINVAMGN